MSLWCRKDMTFLHHKLAVRWIGGKLEACLPVRVVAISVVVTVAYAIDSEVSVDANG
jgi:hypothetical protein